MNSLPGSAARRLEQPLRVHLTSVAAGKTGLEASAFEKVVQCAAVDRFRVHEVVADPDRADLILFAETDQGVGPFATDLRFHRLVRRWRDKCFVYNASDLPVAYLPGLYASMPRQRYNESRVRTSHYLLSHVSVPALRTKSMEERALLYSFLGDSRNAKVRKALMGLRHPRGTCVDVSSQVPDVWKDPERRTLFLERYADTLADTKFSLCPRGLGPNSMRLFESMRAGCVPVILADDWVPPVGPAWSDFAVLVREDQVVDLPGILEDFEPHAARMGEAARIAWESWFADDVSFHRLVEWCVDIIASRRLPETLNPRRFLALTERFWPSHLPSTLRWMKGVAHRRFI